MGKYDWDAIKAKTDIASVIGQVVPLKKRGRNIEGCCPFHNEKTPSFKVFDDHYHCFGCGAHGDVVDFVMAIDGCEPAEAIRKLGAGEITMDSQTKAIVEERNRDQERSRADAIERAREKWKTAEQASEAHSYLVEKQIEPHTARQIGKRLLLPVYDRQGQIQSVQGIEENGDKIFMQDAPMKGGRMHFGIAIGRTIICEGFATGASIFEAIPDRVTVGFSSAGVKDLVRELHADGMDLAIAADRTGLSDYIALGEELGIPVFAPPSPYDDFNDLAVGKGREAVAEILRGKPLVKEQSPEKPVASFSSPANDDADPIDIWSRNEAPHLPTGLLPPIIERWAGTRARQIGCDPGGMAMSALAVAAAAIPDTIRVKVKEHEGWTEEARLWVMLVGTPSSKKSPIMRAATAQIKRMDSEMLDAYQQRLSDWKQKKANDADFDGERPVEEHIRIEDTTMEAAQEVCKTSPLGILALQDELSGWFGGIEKYAAGKGGGKDRAFWLQAYNGGPYKVDRISRGSFRIDNLSVSILGGIQPDALRRVCEDATDDGLIQRFLPVILHRASRGVDEEMPETQADYDSLIARLRHLRTRDGLYGPMPLLFSAEARKIRYDLEGEHFEMVETLETVSARFASHIGKYDGIFPRLALIFHCIEHVNSEILPDEISGETAQRAADFLHGYILQQAKAFYHGLLGVSADQDTLEDVAGYILAHEVDVVTPRTFARGSKSMRKLTKWNMEPICEQLEALGWLEPTSHRRSDTMAYKVNPRVHERYRERAEYEREERAEKVEMIRKLVGS